MALEGRVSHFNVSLMYGDIDANLMVIHSKDFRFGKGGMLELDMRCPSSKVGCKIMDITISMILLI